MHPAVQKLIEEQRAQEKREREQVLLSLGLVEEQEEREYAKGLFGDAEIARSCGYDCCEIVNGNAHYYRVKRSQTSLNLTDEEYAEVYKIYQERKAKESQSSPVQVTLNELNVQGETAPKSKFEPSFLSKAFRIFAWICWVGGFIAAIGLSSFEIENYYGRVESQFSFAAFLAYCVVFFSAGLFWHAIAHILDALDAIAANTGGRKFSFKKDAK